MDSEPAKLTAKEQAVLAHLARAWNAFVALGITHADDGDLFARAIHQAQAVVALRVARRADPGVWSHPL